MSEPRVTLIVNPAAGRGRGARALPAAAAAFASLGARVVTTECAGDERRLARAAIDAGATALAVLGGDGTWSNVAAAILEAESDCVLAPIDAGTGSDWVKSVPAPARDAAAMAALVARGESMRADVGAIEDGGPRGWFVNVASFGFAAAATEAAQRVRWLSGEALYGYAALTQLFGFRGVPVRVSGGGAPADAPTALLLAVGNGRHFGGKFAIAPDASITDGRLDLVRVGDAGPVRRARLFAAATRGAHVGMAEVTVRRDAAFELRFPAPPRYEADGELRAAASETVRLRCLAGALRVAAPADGTR